MPVEDVALEIGERRARSTLPRPAVTSARVSGRQVTCTVVSVIPYMLTSCGCVSAWRANQGPSVAQVERFAAEDDVAQRERVGRAAPASSSRISCRKADGVWFSTVTRSASSRS